MTSAGLPGARESSAGDEFHILWAVRRVLGLLDPASGLNRVVMEDLTPVPPEGVDPELLLAADMAEYYGGTELTTSERVVVSQLKYSHRHPERSWTAARLAQTGPRGQKGVIARLADLYTGVSGTGARSDVLGRLEIRLVTNMKCGAGLAAAVQAAKAWLAERPSRARRADLLGALGEHARTDIQRLSDASGLGSFAFTDFMRVLDLNFTGATGRADQELAITQSLAEHVFDDLRHASLALADLVRKRALPEGSGRPIERPDVLAALEVPSERELLPAPPRFSPPANRVRTPDTARILAELDAASDRRVLAHGAAGVGKTTTIIALNQELPPGSIVLTYDCFGDGDYETPGAARHDGFRFGLQLCNELAVRCRLPVLIRPPRSAHDLWRELERRMHAAGRLLGEQGSRLLVVVDAADNSAWAGRRFGEDTFLRYLWAQPVPEGTGLVVTCRSGRRDSIDPPAGIAQVELRGFDENASAAYLRSRFPYAGDAEARVFHERSAGNPRVQFYVLFQDRADAPVDLADAVERAQLTPPDIFKDLLEAAVARAPAADEARDRLAELVCLTKPLTNDRFGAVSGLAAERVRDFCESLVPGVVTDGEVIAFRDEDFVNFLREEVGANEEAAAHSRLADLFLRQQADPYAALVVADHLHNAGRGGDLVALAHTAGAPEAIADPLARQQTYRRRLTLALRYAADESDRAAVCRLVVLGGDAARQNLAVGEILRRRPDLGMRYGDPEAVMRVYSAADKASWQGPVHMQLAALYARSGDHDRARAEARQAHAWLVRWMEEEQRHWDLDADDVAAYAEAFFHVHGPAEAEAQLRSWSPASFAAEAAVALVRRLALSVPAKELGALIAGPDLPAATRARLLAAAFGAGTRVQAEHVAAVSELLLSAPPQLEPSDGWWAASFAELAAVAGMGAAFVLELADALQLPPPGWAPHRYERLGRFRDVLRLAVLRAACAERELQLDELMPASVADAPDEPRRRVDVESERRAMHENVGRYLHVFASRARALLRSPVVTELRSEWDDQIASQLRQSEYRSEPDFGYRLWLAALTDALLACRGTDVELIRDAVAAAPAIAGAGDHACWMTVARRLVHDQRYRDEGLRLLERAAAQAAGAEWPASQQADALLAACAIADPFDPDHARDLHARAVSAAEGMDDEGIGRLELHARVASELAATPEARDLAERTGQTLVAHRRRVTDEDRLPWRATLRAIALLHPQTAVALVGRWEDEGHMLLSSTLPASAAPLAESGFLTPIESLALLRLAGEETNPVSAATALIEQLPPGQRADAVSELSLRIRCDLLPDTRTWAAQLLHKWASGQGYGDAAAVRALESLVGVADERLASRPWAAAAASERDEREAAADAIVTRAAHGDPAAVDNDLRELAELFAGGRIEAYLEAVTEAVIPSRRIALVDALAALPTDHPVAHFHADDILDTLVRAATAWSGSSALRRHCAHAIARLLEAHFEAMTRYGGDAERVVAKVLALDCLNDPAGLVLRAVGASMDRLSPVALYGTASELASQLEHEERVDFLRWSLDGFEVEPVTVPELPVERADVLAGLLWSLFAAPDKATRWRTAHVARYLIAGGDEALARALLGRTKTRDGGAFVAPDLQFYWHSAQVWVLMVIARVARDAPETVAALAPELAVVARDRNWPHVGVRSLPAAPRCESPRAWRVHSRRRL